MTSEAPLPSRALMAAQPDEAFDRIANLVRKVIDVPVALVSLVDVAQQIFPGAAGLPQPWSQSRCTPLSHSFCQYVVRSAQPLVVTDARLDPRLRENLAIGDIGVIAYAGYPLTLGDGRVVGSLCAIDGQPRDWTTTELELLRDLAEACAAELQLRDAAEAAARAEERSRALLEFAETLADTETIVDVGAAVSTLAITRLNAYFGGITIVEPDGKSVRYVDVTVLPDEVRDNYRVSALDREAPSPHAARTGEPLHFEDLEALRARFPQAAADIEPSGTRASAFQPMRLTGELLGNLTILWRTDRQFDAEDRALLAGLAGYAAQAVVRARLLADRRAVAETLQASMLPTLPEVPWLELAGRYLPARATDAVGGDWFDAFERPDGSVAVSVGDVEGHDTTAAAVMGQLRSVLRGLTFASTSGPSVVITAMDDLLAAAPTPRYATCVLGILRQEPGGDRIGLSWANAAHLPPIVLEPGRAARLLTAQPQLPIGMPFRPDRVAAEVTLAPGSTLLFYSDGLVEVPGGDLDEGVGGLVGLAQRHRERPLPDLVDTVLADRGDDDHNDDVVLFGVRIRGA